MNRPILTPMIALWGGATLVAMMGSPMLDQELLGPATLGAGFAGALTAPLFARPNSIWAFAAPILTTTLGAALAGAYTGWPADIPLGLAFGPAVVWASIAQSPVVALVWLIGAVILRRVAYSLK